MKLLLLVALAACTYGAAVSLTSVAVTCADVSGSTDTCELSVAATFAGGDASDVLAIQLAGAGTFATGKPAIGIYAVDAAAAGFAFDTATVEMGLGNTASADGTSDLTALTTATPLTGVTAAVAGSVLTAKGKIKVSDLTDHFKLGADVTSKADVSVKGGKGTANAVKYLSKTASAGAGTVSALSCACKAYQEKVASIEVTALN